MKLPFKPTRRDLITAILAAVAAAAASFGLIDTETEESLDCPEVSAPEESTEESTEEAPEEAAEDIEP